VAIPLEDLQVERSVKLAGGQAPIDGSPCAFTDSPAAPD